MPPGRTPLPCAHCNSDLKFATLFDRARGLAPSTSPPDTMRASSGPRKGAGCSAGARTREGPVVFPLRRLTQAQLARASFPVGGLAKPEVRAHAHRLGLQVADKAGQSGDLLRARRRLCVVRVAARAGGSSGRCRSSTDRVTPSAATAACTVSPSVSARAWDSRALAAVRVEDRG